jgi:hypothetical protein
MSRTINEYPISKMIIVKTVSGEIHKFKNAQLTNAPNYYSIIDGDTLYMFPYNNVEYCSAVMS